MIIVQESAVQAADLVSSLGSRVSGHWKEPVLRPGSFEPPESVPSLKQYRSFYLEKVKFPTCKNLPANFSFGSRLVTFYLARYIPTPSRENRQLARKNRFTTVTSFQPPSSKWWCKGAIRKIRFPWVSLKYPTWSMTDRASST